MFFTTHMRITALLLLVLHFYTDAMALTFDGRISVKKSQVSFFEDGDNKSYTLVGSSETVSTFIKRLKSGDFVSIEGSRNSTQLTITVEAFNYVGLKDLLGVWVANDSYCYNFSSFTEFTISSKVNGRKCTPALSSHFTYLTSPSANSWVLLISGQHASYLGDLKFISPNNIQIELFDSETGDILRTLNLRK